MRVILMPLAALAVTACAPDPAAVDAEIQQFARTYVTSTDVTASLNMLDQGGTVTSITGEGVIMRGREAIRDHANRHIASIRDQRITVGAIEVTRIGATHALVTAPFSATVSALPQLTLAEGAVTLLVTRRDSGWKVVHEHYSYPSIRRP
jgi:ketosteroid isomerase-like protein